MAKPSRRRCPELVEGFSRTVNIHCTNLRDVSLAVVVRRAVCCDQRECRSIEGVLQALFINEKNFIQVNLALLAHLFYK